MKTMIGEQRLCHSCNQKSWQFIKCVYLLREFGVSFQNGSAHFRSKLFDSAPKMLMKINQLKYFIFLQIDSNISW